ncbi:hypothetical protein SAMN02910456_02599 [Ruminococcaceae bacterium YRB3002]|nr:hypothetical protein SAMN02910456_02599 [Ruminococcaceae bacterium YRB3002]
MERRPLTVLQVVIGVLALLYVVSPDLLLGPFDDAAIGSLAVIAEVVLGVIKGRIPQSFNSTGDQEEVIKDVDGDDYE